MTPAVTLVWFLVIHAKDGGLLAIEQPSLEQCQKTAQWIFRGSRLYGVNTDCIQGVKP